MAVYTKINKKDISYINRKFDVEEILEFEGIKQGIENTNYLLKSKNKKFILTIFEKRVSKKELPFFMNLMDKLNKSKINCPKPQKKKDGGLMEAIEKVKAKKMKEGGDVDKEFPEPKERTAEFRIEMIPKEFRKSFRDSKG